jgi:hypothetical protein
MIPTIMMSKWTVCEDRPFPSPNLNPDGSKSGDPTRLVEAHVSIMEEKQAVVGTSINLCPRSSLALQTLAGFG